MIVRRGLQELPGLLDELGIEREAAGGVEDDTARLVADALDPRGELRVVGQRGADAHRHGVARGAPAVGDEPAVLAGDPLGVARLGRHLAVEAHGRLEEDPRAPGTGVLAEGLVLLARPGGQLAAREVDLHALVAQDAQAPARGLLGRVVAGDDDAPDAGREDGVRARRLLTVVAARLERHVEGGALQVGVAGGRDRVDLRVRAAVLLVPALAEHPIVLDHHRSDHRVGAHAAHAALGELDGPREVLVIGLGPLH